MQASEPNPTDDGVAGRARRPDLITMDIHKVLSVLPHRYPFLLVDRVVDFKRDDYLVALKNVSYNEPYFVGHFPVRPVMPGVLIVEAMAQATGLLAMASRPEEVGEKALYYFVGIDQGALQAAGGTRRPVVPEGRSCWPCAAASGSSTARRGWMIASSPAPRSCARLGTSTA